MLVNYTQDEREEFYRTLNALYEQEADLRNKLTTASGEEKTRLQLERQQLIEEQETKARELQDKYEHRRIAKLKTPQDFLKEAEKEASQILEHLYKHLHVLPSYDAPTVVVKDLQEYITTRYAFLCLRDEFRLFFDAINSDLEATMELQNIIARAIEESPYTADDNRKEPEVYRRSSLMHLKTYGIMNDNLNAKLIQEPDILKLPIDGQMTIQQYKVKEGKDINTYMQLSYDSYDSQGITFSRKLSAFDISVYNAISSLIYNEKMRDHNGSLYVTPVEIWRTMTGRKINDVTARASEKQLQKLCNSIDKMRRILIYIDLTEEMERQNKYIDDARIIGGKVDTNLLECIGGVEFMLDNSKTVKGYCFDKIPILYRVNEARGRVLSVPYEMLNISEKESNTENMIVFRDYLMAQVKLIKSAQESGKSYKRNSRILIDTIYAATATPFPEDRINNDKFKTDANRASYLRKIRQADRDKIEAILTTWVKKGWIKAYKPVKKGNAITGYDITA